MLIILFFLLPGILFAFVREDKMVSIEINGGYSVGSCYILEDEYASALGSSVIPVEICVTSNAPFEIIDQRLYPVVTFKYLIMDSNEFYTFRPFLIGIGVRRNLLSDQQFELFAAASINLTFVSGERESKKYDNEGILNYYKKFSIDTSWVLPGCEIRCGMNYFFYDNFGLNFSVGGTIARAHVRLQTIESYNMDDVGMELADSWGFISEQLWCSIGTVIIF